MRFNRLATSVSTICGHPLAFSMAAGAIILWALLGPIFSYSVTWQLVVNTGTTIITFLMVFLIQNTQNRDQIATQAKLDELIRAVEGANNALIALEKRDGR